LPLSDTRISRNCAAVVTQADGYYLEDRGQRRGIFVNGEKIQSTRTLAEGDVITFGLEDSYQIIFHAGAIVGKKGSYRVDRARPFAYGRICVLFKGVDQLGAQVCLKLFRSTPRDRV
jgi:hypothetical protein